MVVVVVAVEMEMLGREEGREGKGREGRKKEGNGGKEKESEEARYDGWIIGGEVRGKVI